MGIAPQPLALGATVNDGPAGESHRRLPLFRFCPLCFLAAVYLKLENTFLGIIISWKLPNHYQISQPAGGLTFYSPRGQLPLGGTALWLFLPTSISFLGPQRTATVGVLEGALPLILVLSGRVMRCIWAGEGGTTGRPERVFRLPGEDVPKELRGGFSKEFCEDRNYFGIAKTLLVPHRVSTGSRLRPSPRSPCERVSGRRDCGHHVTLYGPRWFLRGSF